MGGLAGVAGGPPGARACSLAHKCTDPLEQPLGTGQVRAVIAKAGRVIRARAKCGRPPLPPGEVRLGTRGVIGEWSMQSRARAYYALEAIDWGPWGSIFFVTLTYPGGDWPRNGRVCAEHLRAVRRWLERWGFKSGVWKREYQARGAPHFHLWLVCPLSQDERPPGFLRALRQRLSRAWYDVVGSGDPKHLAAGTQVKLLPPGQSAAGYFKAYLNKYSDKEYQNRLPADVEAPGRWWGMFGKQHGFRAVWQFRECSLEELHKFRRMLRGFKRSRRRAARAAARDAGRPFAPRQRARVSRRVTANALAGAAAVVDFPWSTFERMAHAIGKSPILEALERSRGQPMA